MVDALIAVVCFFIVMASEWLHHRRCRRVWSLAFAGGHPSRWVRVMPFIRAVACGLMCWGLLVLFKTGSKDGLPHQGLALKEMADRTSRHVVVVLDVSPSMHITDAGSTGVQKRSQRAIDVMDSILQRVARQDVLYSLVAVYTDARPVIVDSVDTGVLKNIMDLPLEQAFDPGKTHLVKGVRVAFDLAKDWPSGSAIFIMLTDGDSGDVERSEFPQAPKSLAQFVIAGLGTRRGAFIDGHQSRQDGASLQFMASRFNGVYQDVNVRHIPTRAIGLLASHDSETPGMEWTRKQLAIAALTSGALLLALMPMALEFFGFNMSKHLSTKRRLPAGSRAS